MQILEQKKILSELKFYENRMNKKEFEEYQMFIKRQKDDEDFDTISYKKLKELHKKFVIKKSREEAEKIFSELKKTQ